MSKSKNENLTKYLDKNVVYLFLVVFFISGSALAYRYYTDFPCDQINIDIQASDYRVGELIKFKDLTEQGQSWEWDFGDSTDVSVISQAFHIYKEPGEYNVRLLVNNSCEKTETITIKEKKFVLDPTKIPNLIIPDSITVGQELKVKDNTKDAYSWEWRFGETANANATTKSATYVYEESGLKTITLIVNGDIQHIGKKRIRVYEKETPTAQIDAPITEPERPIGWNIPYEPVLDDDKNEDEELESIEVPYISEPDLKRRLYKVSESKITEKEFSNYFCGDVNKPIVVNGRNTTFLVFCQRIRGKRINIKRLTIFRNDGSNCIKNLNVEYSRKIL